MKVKTPTLGGVAQSLQGRDKGAFYVICAIEGDAVFLADGKTRTKEKPKRKNLKHVRLLPKNAREYGIEYPWDNSFNVRTAYMLKQISAAVPTENISED